MTSDEYWMEQALRQARLAFDCEEVPVGAVLVREGEVLGSGYNQPISSTDPTAHAEVVALRNAAKQVSNYRLPESTLYVTVEPCTMCFGALVHARVSRVVYGTTEPRAGVFESRLGLADAEFYNHSIQYEGGVLADECAELMTRFFRKRR